MEEQMDEIRWTDVLQSIGVIAALGFTGWEMRQRSREQKFQNYFASISAFVELARMMVEKPELQGLYTYSAVDLTKPYEEMSSDERSMVHYCDTVLALCETVWLATREKWLANDEWPFWQRWTRDLNRSPYFRWTLAWVDGEYDPAFLATLQSQATAREL